MTTSLHIIVKKLTPHLSQDDSFCVIFNGKTYEATIGRSGVSTHHLEGDGSTPIGHFPLRKVFYNPSRLSLPATHLTVVAIHPNDGWCDDPQSPLYNQQITLPFAHAHEKLWRDDSLYDVFIEVGYNDDPIIPGKGSAIFIHVRPDHGKTQGCVSLQKEALLEIISHLSPGSMLMVEP